jgi:chalcone isomerase-like protein
MAPETPGFRIRAMQKTAVVTLLLGAALASSLPAQDVTEPKSGTKFAAKLEDKSLLGTGLRTKTFLKVKVYALGLYVADSAISGPLAAYKGKTSAPDFYRELVQGDFPKQVNMKFLRDLEAKQIQDAFRETLEGADKAKVDAFVGYFPALTSGQECVITWAPGGTLETVVAGAAKPPIADKAFAAKVFAIWLGEKPIQEDLKAAIVSRAPELIR